MGHQCPVYYCYCHLTECHCDCYHDSLAYLFIRGYSNQYGASEKAPASLGEMSSQRLSIRKAGFELGLDDGEENVSHGA